jgi:hypothetical protein
MDSCAFAAKDLWRKTPLHSCLVLSSGLDHWPVPPLRRRACDGPETGWSVVPRLFGPRRVSQSELFAVFAEGWSLESIEPSRYEVRPDLKDLQFSEGGSKAWCVTVSRTC